MSEVREYKYIIVQVGSKVLSIFCLTENTYIKHQQSIKYTHLNSCKRFLQVHI